jgi:hypothetical protein
MNAGHLVGGDGDRVSTISSIMSRAKEDFTSTPAGYVIAGEEPGQGSNLDRAEQQNSLV